MIQTSPWIHASDWCVVKRCDPSARARRVGVVRGLVVLEAPDLDPRIARAAGWKGAG